MQEYIKEVGRGKKGAKDLTFEQAKEAAARIFDGEATDAQIGAFFIAERVKGETVPELLGFIEAARERSSRISHRQNGVLDCAGPYDGRAKSFAATIPVAVMLAATDVPVVLHGSSSLPPKYGVALRDVMQELGVATDVSGDQLAELIDQQRIAFIETENFCPPLRELREMRKDLGVRTLLNTAEKFLNVGRADYLVAGVFHTTALDKAAELAIELGYEKAMIVQGIDGSEDIPANRPSAICIVENGSIQKHLVNPKDYGLFADNAPASLSAAEQAAQIEQVLQGSSEYRNMTILNCALRLWLTGQTQNIEQGIQMAQTILDSGKALDKLVAWRKLTSK